MLKRDHRRTLKCGEQRGVNTVAWNNLAQISTFDRFNDAEAVVYLTTHRLRLLIKRLQWILRHLEGTA